MEPTIYKPSIYKDAGIYKTGAGGVEINPYAPNYKEPLILADKEYKVIQIGSLLWMAENLDYRWEGLSSDMTLSSAAANYYNDDAATYGKNGLIYNGYARDELIALLSNGLLDGWRFPKTSEFETMCQNFITTYFNPRYGSNSISFTERNIVSNLKSKEEWDGNNSFGFNLLRCGLWDNGWTGITSYTCLWTNSKWHYDWGNNTYLMKYQNENYLGVCIRLVKDL